MASLLTKVWWVVRGVFVAINNLYCIPTYVIWMIFFQPLLFLAPRLFWRIEGLFFHWLLTMVAFWSHSAHYRLVESGDEVEGLIGEETLLLVNHQSTSDVPLLMAAFAARPSILPNLNWIMDAVFKYTNFGVVSWIHGDFFINAGRERRAASVQELVEYLKKFFVPRRRKWLVLFPEGGFLRKRKETSNRYCRRIGLPELHNVTLPRMGAIQAIVDTIGLQQYRQNSVKKDGPDSELKWIVDMTIAYPKGKPLDLVAIVSGCVPACVVHLHYKIYPIHQVPVEKKELQDWLYSRYMEKEGMLGKYYEEEVWSEGEGRLVEQDLLRILLIHLFFILSSLTHIFLFIRLYASLAT